MTMGLAQMVYGGEQGGQGVQHNVVQAAFNRFKAGEDALAKKRNYARQAFNLLVLRLRLYFVAREVVQVQVGRPAP
jgi:hypothetical protein